VAEALQGRSDPRRSADDDGCLLRIRNLTVTYGLGSRRQVRAVADVSLEVGRGRTLALIGESGSGKSSIARAVCGWAPIEGGSITMDGHELTTAPDRPAAAGERGIQIVFQDPVSALDPRWPVWRSVAEPLIRSIESTGERRARAESLLERVGLDRSFGERRPHQLSGGQRQRVTIARALAPAPKLVILDEAVSALDVSVRNEILVLLDDLKRGEGLTYLLISHDMGAVAQMATEIAVTYLGKVVESGEARQVIRHPVHPYTDALLASVPTVSGDAADPSFRPLGEIGDSAHPPSGCRYHPRCPLAIDLCTAQEPAMLTVRDRLAACHRAEETGADAVRPPPLPLPHEGGG